MQNRLHSSDIATYFKYGIWFYLKWGKTNDFERPKKKRFLNFRLFNAYDKLIEFINNSRLNENQTVFLCYSHYNTHASTSMLLDWLGVIQFWRETEFRTQVTKKTELYVTSTVWYAFFLWTVMMWYHHILPYAHGWNHFNRQINSVSQTIHDKVNECH